jgi:hypothetical protein
MLQRLVKVALVIIAAAAVGTAAKPLLTSASVNAASASGPAKAQTAASGTHRAATTTVLASSASPSEVHSPLTLSATVTRQGLPGVPTGSVEFYANGTSLGTVPLTSAGTAQLTSSAAPMWTVAVRAVYRGDAADYVSASTLPHTITAHPTATSLSSSMNPGKVGLQITLIAAVTTAPTPDGLPRGNVQLVDRSTTPATVIDTKWLDTTEHATFNKITLSAGTHLLTSVYQGQGLFSSSTSAVANQDILTTGYTGALPFAYEAGFVTASTNVARVVQNLAGTPAAGISWKFRWSELETAPGVYNWTAVDNSINAARALNKPVMLRVVAGIYSPGWVLSSVPTVSIPNVYFPNTGPYANPTLTPVVWSSGYLADWTAFVRAFGARYDGNSSVYLVHAGGAGDIGDMYLAPDMALWNAAGYSDSNLLAAWETILNAYKQAFTRTAVAIGITEPIICTAVSSGFTNSTCAAGSRSNVLLPLAGWIQANDSHLFLQNNGLSGRYLAAGIFTTRSIMRAACQYTTIGYQTNGASSGLTDITDAFQVVRQDQAGYIEVYVDDLTNSAYAGAFRYLQFGTAP